MMFLSLMITHIIAVLGEMADPSPAVCEAAGWAREQNSCPRASSATGRYQGWRNAACYVSEKEKKSAMKIAQWHFLWDGVSGSCLTWQEISALGMFAEPFFDPSGDSWIIPAGPPESCSFNHTLLTFSFSFFLSPSPHATIPLRHTMCMSVEENYSIAIPRSLHH